MRRSTSLGLAAVTAAMLLSACHLGGEPPEPGDPATVTGPTVISATVGGADASDVVTLDLATESIRFGCSSNVNVTSAAQGELSCTGSADSAIILVDGDVLTVTSAVADTAYLLGFVPDF